MSIFAFLKRLFSLLILPGDSAAARKRSLSSLLKEIERKGPKWYRPWTDRLTADFAQNAEKLRRATARMSRVYALTIGSDEETARKAQTALLDSFLRESGSSLEALSFESIREETEKRGAVDDLEAMDALFKTRIEGLHSDAMNKAAEGYRENLRLASLSSFHWDELSAPFGKRNGTPARSSVPAAPLASALADLYYLVAELKISEGCRKVFALLRESSGIDGYGPEAASEDIAVVYVVLGTRMEASELARVVRAVHDDADFELRSDEVAFDFRKAEEENATEEYAKRRRVMDDRITAEKLEAARKSLFGDAPLLPTHGYTAEISEALLASRLPPLERIIPLSIIKSFLTAFYAPRVRPTISKAVVQLDFQNVEFRTSLSDAADAALELRDDIEEFEEAASSPGRQGLLGTVGVAGGSTLEGAEELSARRVVEGFNDRANKIVQQAFARFAIFSTMIVKLRGDLKARAPVLVADAAAVNVRAPELARGIEDAAESVDLFLALLRRTAVDAGAAKRALEEAVSAHG